MATDCIAQVTFEFDPKRKPVVAVFDAEHASSDGGGPKCWRSFNRCHPLIGSGEASISARGG